MNYAQKANNCLDQPISIKFDQMLELLFVLQHGSVALLRSQNKALLSLLFIEFIEADLYNRYTTL